MADLIKRRVLLLLPLLCFLNWNEVEGTLPIIITKIETSVAVGVPYSFILPTFVRRRRRSLDSDSDLYFDLNTKEGIGFSRLHYLFSSMGVEDSECQKRLLCMVSQDPDKYSPLTEVIFQYLDPRVDNKAVITNETLASHLRYNEFHEAGRKGFYPGTNCQLETTSCTYNPDTAIDWSKMKTYHLLKRFLNVSFK